MCDRIELVYEDCEVCLYSLEYEWLNFSKILLIWYFFDVVFYVGINL